MLKTLWGDLETWSETPIKEGTYRYAQDAELMLFTYALDDDPVSVWDLTADEPMPDDLAEALLDDSVLINFQNSMFDRSVFRLARNTNPILVQAGEATHRWRDTMVMALAHSLPGALGKTCEIFNLAEDVAKQKDGKALIQLFCKPRPKKTKLRRATAATHPAEWARFIEYAKGDITSMRIVDRKIPTWNFPSVELSHWHLDQKINDRGVLIDLDLAHAAIAAAEGAKARLSTECQALTNGEVESATKRDKLLAHLLLEYGIDLPDLQASTLERRVNDPDLPPAMKELLINRMQASMGSTSKYKAMLKAVNDDGRARGLLQFDGASRTGRWGGRTVQPQNMFRPPKYLSKDWEFSVEAVKAGAAPLFFDNVMEATAGLARAALIPARGKKFVVADLSNIEGRMLAWLAGEEWKLQAFRDFDAGTGHDLYKLAYANSFGIEPEDVDGDQRQVGKVQELALGFQGGVGAFLTFALVHNIDLEELATSAFATLPDWAKLEAKKFYDYSVKKKRSTFGLSEKGFVVCDALKRMWRAAHPNIEAFWEELESAFFKATNNAGKKFAARRCTFVRSGNWLRVIMPSGRSLCYPSPRAEGENEPNKRKLSYMGVNQYTRQWQRVGIYGGKCAENITQSCACHVLKDAMPGIEAAGYEIVLTVHDETITEAPDTDEFNEAQLSELLAANPPWALDMPLAAAGFQGYRYRKG